MSKPLRVDRISALPDEILMHILSLLPTKLAFTTTVLSKRWMPLWHSLTALHFDDEGVKDKETCLRFCRFVDTVLLSPHVPIETLSIISHSKGGSWGEWLEAAKRRSVQKLQLSTLKWTVSLPPIIFTSRTLVVLKLKGFYMFAQNFGPFDLPSLKTLHLIETYFTEREDLKKLLSGCPILVDLYAPLHFLYQSYNYTGYKTLPKLEKACIRALDVPFTAIDNVEFLRIERMERRDKYDFMPVFQNLISIELCFDRFYGWGDVVEVLPYCPKLQSLIIEKQRCYLKCYQEKLEYTEPVPECVSFHLRTCSIRNYQGHQDDDFKFAEFILQNARFLQAMKLHSAPSMEEDEKHCVFKRLSRCSKISPACEIFLDTEEINQQEHEKLISAP